MWYYGSDTQETDAGGGCEGCGLRSGGSSVLAEKTAEARGFTERVLKRRRRFAERVVPADVRRKSKGEVSWKACALRCEIVCVRVWTALGEGMEYVGERSSSRKVCGHRGIVRSRTLVEGATDVRLSWDCHVEEDKTQIRNQTGTCRVALVFCFCFWRPAVQLWPKKFFAAAAATGRHWHVVLR